MPRLRDATLAPRTLQRRVLPRFELQLFCGDFHPLFYRSFAHYFLEYAPHEVVVPMGAASLCHGHLCRAVLRVVDFAQLLGHLNREICLILLERVGFFRQNWLDNRFFAYLCRVTILKSLGI